MSEQNSPCLAGLIWSDTRRHFLEDIM